MGDVARSILVIGLPLGLVLVAIEALVIGISIAICPKPRRRYCVKRNAIFALAVIALLGLIPCVTALGESLANPKGFTHPPSIPAFSLLTLICVGLAGGSIRRLRHLKRPGLGGA